MTPIVAIVGPSGSGKTALLRNLIRVLKDRGYRVGAIKHTHHEFELDQPGKDSFEMKAAGAEAVCILGPSQLGLVREVTDEISLVEIAEKYFLEVDIVLAEGFKQEPVPHIAVVRGEAQIPSVNRLIGIVSDRVVPESKTDKTDESATPFTFEEVQELASFLEDKFLK